MVPSESTNQPSVCPAGRSSVGSCAIARHAVPSCEVSGCEPGAACGNRMSTALLNAETGACVLRVNADTLTTTAFAGTPVTEAAGLGATSTTTASSNVPADQPSMRPSGLSSSPAETGTAFFCTCGAVALEPPVPGAQMVK